MFLGLMPDAAVVVDADGMIVSANGGAGVLFDYPPEVLTGRPIEVLVPERFRHRHRQDRAVYGASPRPRSMGAGLDLTGRRRDGTEFPIDISLAPVGGADRPLVVAAIRDATERRAATAAQAELAAIVRSSVDAMVAMTLEGAVTSWNPGAEQLFGHVGDEMVGQHISRLLADEASALLEELMGSVMEGLAVTPRDTVWRTKDGQVIDVAISVSPMRDPGNRLLGFSVLARDITARKRAEAEQQRLLLEVQAQERWQSAAAEIRLSLLSGMPLEVALELVCRRACDLLGCQAAMIVQPGGEVAASAGAAEILAERLGTAHIIAETQRSGVPMIDLQSGPEGDRPLLAAPMLSDRGVAGVLVVVGTRSGATGDEVVLGDGDLGRVESLAGQAALAVELGLARQDREHVLLAGDRERIARDLHDLVIQRLFAVGMGLQGVQRLIDNERAAERVSNAVDELDATIREIRSAIFALEVPPAAESGLRSRILQLAAGAAEPIGCEPSVRFEGPVDSLVSDAVAVHLLAVAREALSNIARHAHASRVQIDLSAGDEAVLVVVDDGVGWSETGRESGLANLRSRAEDLGGTFRLTTPDEGGTKLEWRVPIRPEPS